MWKKVPLFLSTPNFLTDSWFLLTRNTPRFIRVLLSWSGVVCLFSVSARMCACKCVCEYSMWRPEVCIRIWANIFPLLPICCSFQQGFPAKFSYSLFLVSMLFGALGNPLTLYSQATNVVETTEESHGVSSHPMHPLKAVSNVACFPQHMWLDFIKTGIPSVGWEFQLRQMTQLSSSSLYTLANPIPIITLSAHLEVCPWEQWFLILELLWFSI